MKIQTRCGINRSASRRADSSHSNRRCLACDQFSCIIARNFGAKNPVVANKLNDPTSARNGHGRGAGGAGPLERMLVDIAAVHWTFQYGRNRHPAMTAA